MIVLRVLNRVGSPREVRKRKPQTNFSPATAVFPSSLTVQSSTASDSDPVRDRLAGGWILAEAERMQELVNHDDLRSPSILKKPISELPPADANGPRAGLGERQRRARAALRGLAVIEEPQESEGFG
jgi:hypothetical protein